MLSFKQTVHGKLRLYHRTKWAPMLMNLECCWSINLHHLKSTRPERERAAWMSSLLVR